MSRYLMAALIALVVGIGAGAGAGYYLWGWPEDWYAFRDPATLPAGPGTT
jgi:hypothetical protein